MTWQTPVFLIVAGGAFGYSASRMLVLWKLLKAMKGKDPTRFGRVSERVKTTILNVLGQKAVLQKPVAGIMHATIFWGFLVITLGTLEQFATTLHPAWDFEFLGNSIYRTLLVMQDFFTGAVLLAVMYAFYRRLIVRPPGLGKSKDAINILIFTGSLMVSIFLMNSFHILGTHSGYADSFFISGQISHLLEGFQFSPETALVLATVFKWIHMLLVLGFACYIPNSKHLHVLAAGPNTYLRTLDLPKGMKKIDFADESVTQYGAAKVSDLTWKDTLDYYACTECGRCQDLCPAWNTEKPLSPKLIIADLKYNLYRNKDKVLAGKFEEVEPLIDKSVTEDVIWACTSCRACEIACPVFIEQTDKIYAARRNLVMMESKFPAEVQPVFKNIETNSTPWAFSADDRDKWTEGASVPTMAQNPNPEVLLWVGCAGSYDDRNKKVVRAFVSILKKAGVNFSILGKEEKCTGDPARRIGNEYLFQQMATANVETLNRYSVKKIVTACPHCFNTLKNEYPDFGGNYEVVHHSQFLAQLIHSGKIKPTKALDETVTFHDSCYMGRWNNEYESPRATLASVPSVKLVEMKQNHEKSMCCGAGGGRMFMEETIGRRINVVRTEQAIETQAGVIAASCPFCMTMLTDGVKTKEKQEQMKVMDIAEILDQATP